MGQQAVSRLGPALITLAVLAAPLGAVRAGEIKALEPAVPILAVSKIKPGMKGTGYTVYSGKKIETFDVLILGVLPGAWGPDDDVILCRILGPNADRYGIAAGMSGSPVYIDGKLVGALSLAYGGFQREPIGGITPIESMLRVPVNLRADAAEPGRAVPVKIASAQQPGALRPISTPLVLSGFDPKAVPLVVKTLEPYGFAAVSGGGAVAAPLVSGSASGSGATGKVTGRKLKPGSAVAGILVQGDINIQGMGTLTYVDDDVALAFGHSFLLYGDVEMPLADAQVVATVPSDQLSFKVGYPTEVVGAVVRDNRTAIAGKFGTQAKMLPVKLTVDRGADKETFQFEVFRNKVLTSLMVGAAVINALVGAPGYDAEGTVKVEGVIRVDGYPDLKLEHVFFDLGPSGSLIPLIAEEVGDLLRTLLNNPIAPAHVKGVELSFEAVPGKLETRIEAAWTDRNLVHAGDHLAVKVRMRPHQGPPSIQTVDFVIPEGTPSGELSIRVAAGSVLDEPTPDGANGHSDLKRLIDELNRRRADDALYVRITRPAAGVVVRGVDLDGLPPSVLSVVQGGSLEEKTLSETPIAEKRVPLGARVVGDVTVKVNVR